MSALVLKHHGIEWKFHSDVSRDQHVSALDPGHTIGRAAAAAATAVVSLWELP